MPCFEYLYKRFVKILMYMSADGHNTYRRVHTCVIYTHGENAIAKVQGRGGIEDGERVAHSLHGKHAACLWRWFLEVDVARMLLFQISEPAATGDVETRRAWRIESLKRNVYRENHDETFGQNRIFTVVKNEREITIKIISYELLFPLILRDLEIQFLSRQIT